MHKLVYSSALAICMASSSLSAPAFADPICKVLYSDPDTTGKDSRTAGVVSYFETNILKNVGYIKSWWYSDNETYKDRIRLDAFRTGICAEYVDKPIETMINNAITKHNLSSEKTTFLNAEEIIFYSKLMEIVSRSFSEESTNDNNEGLMTNYEISKRLKSLFYLDEGLMLYGLQTNSAKFLESVLNIALILESEEWELFDKTSSKQLLTDNSETLLQNLHTIQNTWYLSNENLSLIKQYSDKLIETLISMMNEEQLSLFNTGLKKFSPPSKVEQLIDIGEILLSIHKGGKTNTIKIRRKSTPDRNKNRTKRNCVSTRNKTKFNAFLTKYGKEFNLSNTKTKFQNKKACVTWKAFAKGKSVPAGLVAIGKTANDELGTTADEDRVRVSLKSPRYKAWLLGTSVTSGKDRRYYRTVSSRCGTKNRTAGNKLSTMLIRVSSFKTSPDSHFLTKE